MTPLFRGVRGRRFPHFVGLRGGYFSPTFALMKKTILFVILALGGISAAAQQRVTFGASYTGDWVNNLRGGIATGSAYLGMATLTADIRLWQGAQIHAMGANTHGDMPSASLIGDMQVASNIEAGELTYLQEAWIRQRLGRVELTLGLQDMAVEMGSVEYADLYLNSSFGVKSTISHNMPAPIFPLTSLGLTAKWELSPRLTWVAALYDGDPAPLEGDNRHNTRWSIRHGDLLAVSELQLHTDPATYKVGATLHDKNISFYANAHRRLDDHWGAFVQLGYAPHEETSDHYVGLGVNYTGLFFEDDRAGLAMAHEHFLHDHKPSESTIELTWRSPTLWSGCFVQPDIQYIIDPAGMDRHLKNALVASLRLGWEL